MGGGGRSLLNSWLYLQAIDLLCVWGEGSSKCVNPFFLVAVAGPPSCFPPQIITIFFLLRPPVTRPMHPPTAHPIPWSFFKGLHGMKSNQDIHTCSTRAWPHTFDSAYMLPNATFRGQQSYTRSELLDMGRSFTDGQTPPFFRFFLIPVRLSSSTPSSHTPFFLSIFCYCCHSFLAHPSLRLCPSCGASWRLTDLLYLVMGCN